MSLDGKGSKLLTADTCYPFRGWLLAMPPMAASW
jgi:hypothetical protein